MRRMRNKANLWSERPKNGLAVNRKCSIGRAGIYGGVSVLTLLLLMMLFPVTKSRTFAACTPDASPDECMATPISTEVGVTTNTVISLALDNQVQMEVTPKSNGATSYASTKLAVSTNSKEGYAIFLQTGTSDGDLVGVTSGMDDTSKISNTTKSGVTLGSLETDSYGYALSTTPINDSSTYSHVPTSNTAIYNKSSSAEMGTGDGDYPYGDEYYLAFGTKIGTTLPAGTYSGTVTVSAVANPTTLRSMYDLHYMQEMTSDICSNTKEGYTKQLIDSRDGKSYWVAKLADGNCWMTQNLGLDLSTEKALTPADSDVSESWTPKTSTENDIPLPKTANNTDTRSWSFGEILFTEPTNNQSCPVQGDETSSVVAVSGEKITENCPGLYKDVEGLKSGYSATETSSISPDGNSYDAHYLIGNYYQWNTATAGTAVGVSGTSATNANGAGLTNASGSICPKGWQLPKAGRNSSATETVFGVGPGQSYDIDGSFYGLLSRYGYNKKWGINNGNGYISMSVGTSRVDYEPMYFTRGGLINASSGSFGSTGKGRYWSSTAMVESSTISYDFDFSSALFPSGYANRYTGSSVRCVSK